MGSVLGDIADLVLARRCLGCEIAPTLLCSTCRLSMLGHAQIARDLRFEDVSAHLRLPLAVAHTYAPPMSALLYRYKDNQIPALAHFLAEVLVGALDLLATHTGQCRANITVVPVPSRRGSQRQRGFDHMALIARSLQRFGIAHAPVLQDTRRTGRSKTLNISQRRLASDQAFTLRDTRALRLLGTRPVMVIDDVTTTGATLHEATETLLMAGVHVTACASIAGSRRKH